MEVKLKTVEKYKSSTEKGINSMNEIILETGTNVNEKLDSLTKSSDQAEEKLVTVFKVSKEILEKED